MRYLLDTCAFLWLAEGNPRLSAPAKAIIRDPANEGAVSSVSFWELSMKSVTGKLPLPGTPALLERLALQQGLDVLPLTVAHVDRFHQMPATHRDPFDRIIAAIAQAAGLVVLTPDPVFDSLGVRRAW